MDKLNFKSFGEGEPIIIAHGLFGMLDNWKTFAKKLADHYLVYIIDLRNHGKSFFNDEMTYKAMAEDIRLFMEDEWIYEARMMGHSMGGKVMMELAKSNEDMIQQMVVVDIAPVKYKGDHRAIFKALMSANIKTSTERREIQAHLEKTILNTSVVQFLMKNLSRNVKEGGFSWKMNLQTIYDYYEDILDFERFEEKCEVDTLFIKGEKSEYITSENLEIISSQFSNAKVKTIEDSGHWVHADKPTILLEECLRYFSTIN